MYIFLLIALTSSWFLKVTSSSYEAVETLDLNKYIGKWYQVYEDNFDKTFQKNGTCAEAYYDFLDGGNISIFNKELLNNKIDTIEGYGYYKDGDSGGYLSVKLADNPEAPYWVIEVGPVVNNYYDYSIVSDNLQISLFVLTRNVDRFYKLYNTQVIESINKFGFTKMINKPIKMDQSDCSSIE